MSEVEEKPKPQVEFVVNNQGPKRLLHGFLLAPGINVLSALSYSLLKSRCNKVEMLSLDAKRKSLDPPPARWKLVELRAKTFKQLRELAKDYEIKDSSKTGFINSLKGKVKK